MTSKLTVLVTGATGQQGGSLARNLIARGHRVRAMTRKTDSAAAKALAAQGAEIVYGNFDEPASLKAAAQGADVVFGMGTPYEAGPEVETKQGLALADAVKAAGTRHFVFSSVADADPATGIPHFDSKLVVEKRIRELGIPHTILAPVFFADNVAGPWFKPKDGVLAMAMPGARKLQHVVVEDLGRLYALIVEQRERYLGQRINIAGDDVSGDEIVSILGEITGKKVRYQEIPLAALRAQNEDFARMFEFFTNHGYTADIQRLRTEFPEVGWTRFADWARKQDWTGL